MKTVTKIFALAGLALTVSSCFNEKSPNYQYMPNMYESVAYETYSEAPVFKGGVEAQLPADGSIKRGFVPYEYPNTNEGLEAARASLQSPLAEGDYNEAEAQQLYEIYCGICHGKTGDGKGKLVTQEKFLGVPSYKDRVITEGSVFHVSTYGINSMGSYANQLNQKERWQVAHYVMKLKGEL